ncbi:hypothetical protein HMPREF1392_00457 [Helicobacter pylori GAM101Biv]|nr:hypothetical protein HMPREF1392_00457 [Helicobacter pylori GAM101Biv]
MNSLYLNPLFFEPFFKTLCFEPSLFGGISFLTPFLGENPLFWGGFFF